MVHSRGNGRREEIAGQVKDDTAFLPPDSGKFAPVNDGSGPSGVTPADVQPDIQGQPDDKPLPPNEHPPLTSSRNTVPHGPTPMDPNALADVPVIGKGVTLSKEIEEVTSRSGSKTEKEPGE